MSAGQNDEKSIFSAAVEFKTPAERTAYLDKVCGAVISSGQVVPVKVYRHY